MRRIALTSLCVFCLVPLSSDAASRNNLDRLIQRIKPIAVKSQTTLDALVRRARKRKLDVNGIAGTCTSETRRAANAFDTVAAFAPNADALWPGALIQGKSLKTGVLAPFDLPRAPGRVNLRFSPTPNARAVASSKIVRRPTQGTVQDSIRELVAGLSGQVTPARVSFTMKRFYSLEHAMLQAGMSASWLSGSVRAQLSSSSYSKRTNFVIKFVQSYYDVTYSPPSRSGASFFSRDAKLSDARRYMGPGNPPGYVSSVTYGRMLLIFASSSKSAKEFRAALSASINAGVGNGKVSISAAHKQLIERSQIHVLAIGGGADAAVSLLTNQKLAALQRYFKTGANFSKKSPGSPISYQVRYLRDNTLARMSYTTDYKIQTGCEFPSYRKPMTVTLGGLYIHDTADDDEDMSVRVRVDILDQRNRVIATRSWGRQCVYVEERRKIGGWRDGKNRFFRGERVAVNRPAFKVRAYVAARTCDGDGFRWKRAAHTWSAGNNRVVLSGGGQGHYKLHLQFR